MSASRFPGRKGYQSAAKATAYSRRSSTRNRKEEALLIRLLEKGEILADPDQTLCALDAPCGVGRMAQFLRDRGVTTIESDISFEMMDLTRALGAPYGFAAAGDLEGRLPFLKQSFDLVLCWRLLQHLPTKEALDNVMAELARVSRKWVVVSFFHPISMHNITRRLNSFLSGKYGCRYSHTKADIRAAAEKTGLKVLDFLAQSAYLKDLWTVSLLKG